MIESLRRKVFWSILLSAAGVLLAILLAINVLKLVQTASKRNSILDSALMMLQAESEPERGPGDKRGGGRDRGELLRSVSEGELGSAFEMGYVTYDFFKYVKIYYLTEFEIFKTESDIYLNMPLDQLLDIKGNNYKNEDKSIIYYLDIDNSDFVRRYKTHDYYLRCEVDNGKVCKINFGFTYP